MLDTELRKEEEMRSKLQDKLKEITDQLNTQKL